MPKLSIATTSWDDGDPKDLKVAELLHARGLRGTFYVPITGYLGRRLTSSDIQGLSKEGFEIGAHTVSHKNLPGLSPEQLNYEVGVCKETLEQIIGRYVLMFCYPNGRYDGKVIQQVRRAGYRGARTVRMLSTDGNFLRFEMPTTLQAYPHPKAAYIRNLARAGNAARLLKYMATPRHTGSWVDLAKRTFLNVLEHGGIWHLYGHSWEIEEQDLWTELREVLDHVSCREGVTYLTNGELV